MTGITDVRSKLCKNPSPGKYSTILAVKFTSTIS